MPVGTRVTSDAAIVTVLGPRDEAWIESAIADPRVALAKALLGAALVPPRPVRIMRVCATAISRRFTCWLSAACVRPTRSAARLITPASAIAAKFRSRSMSSWVLMGH